MENNVLFKVGDRVFYYYGDPTNNIKINTEIYKIRNDGKVKLLNHEGWYSTDFLIKRNK